MDWEKIEVHVKSLEDLRLFFYRDRWKVYYFLVDSIKRLINYIYLELSRPSAGIKRCNALAGNELAIT